MSGDYRDRLGEQFRTAARAQLSATPVRAARRGAHRPVLLAVLALAVVGGGTATALTLVASAPNDPNDPALTSPRSVQKAVPLTRAGLAALKRDRERRSPKLDASRWFAVLTQPVTTADRLPDVRTGRVRSGPVNENAAGTRLAYRGPGGARVFIRATEREVCIKTFATAHSGATGGCAPTIIARRDGVYGFRECLKTPPQRRVFSGVVPDGVQVVRAYRAGVLQASARVQRNGFVLDTVQPVDELRLGTATRELPPVSC